MTTPMREDSPWREGPPSAGDGTFVWIWRPDRGTVRPVKVLRRGSEVWIAIPHVPGLSPWPPGALWAPCVPPARGGER